MTRPFTRIRGFSNRRGRRWKRGLPEDEDIAMAEVVHINALLIRANVSGDSLAEWHRLHARRAGAHRSRNTSCLYLAIGESR
jgi:hypothetical protein